MPLDDIRSWRLHSSPPGPAISQASQAQDGLFDSLDDCQQDQPGVPTRGSHSTIRSLAFENGGRTRKIHGELTKLAFAIGLATVSRYLPKLMPDPGRCQRWVTFLRNHKDAIAAMDFRIVSTVGFQLLYVS